MSPWEDYTETADLVVRFSRTGQRLSVSWNGSAFSLPQPSQAIMDILIPRCRTGYTIITNGSLLNASIPGSYPWQLLTNGSYSLTALHYIDSSGNLGSNLV